MRGQRLRYGLALGCLVAATGLTYLLPALASLTVDFAIAGDTAAERSAVQAWLADAVGGVETLRRHLWIPPLGILLVSLLAGGCTFCKGWLASLASDGIARRLRDDLFDHLNHLPMREHDRANTGDLVQRCTSDVETIRHFLAVEMLEVGHAFLAVGLAAPIMLSLHGPMTLLAFSLLLPLAAYGYRFFLRVRRLYGEVANAEAAMTGVITQNLSGIRVVRAFARQEDERARFARANATFRDCNIGLLALLARYRSTSDFVALGQSGLILFVGLRWVTTGEFTIGLLLAFMWYLGLVLWPVRGMGPLIAGLGRATVSLRRIREILNLPREADVAVPGDAPPAAIRGALQVRHLHFVHDGGKFALEDISFDIAAGETVAILGPSGAGKSTLLQVLLRLYDYSGGSVLLDGRELASLSRHEVRRSIGTVLQEPVLYSRSLRENLRFGATEATDHDLEAAARQACIHETIASLPHGYDTLVGERGVTLSGGQRQRMAIARALVKRPALLFLDDALSAVDSETEAAIVAALRELRGRITMVFVAHRLSTVAHADRIIYLENGRVVQTGTPSELAGREGPYRRLLAIHAEAEGRIRSELEQPSPTAAPRATNV